MNRRLVRCAASAFAVLSAGCEAQPTTPPPAVTTAPAAGAPAPPAKRPASGDVAPPGPSTAPLKD